MFSHQTAKLHLFLLFLVSAVLGLASIYSLVLKCAALDARKANVNRFYLAPDSSHPYTIAVNNTIPLFPVHLNDEATPPVIATAALSLALSLAGLCFSYTSLTKGPFLVRCQSETLKFYDSRLRSYKIDISAPTPLHTCYPINTLPAHSHIPDLRFCHT